VARDRIAAAQKASSGGGGFPFAEFQKCIATDVQRAEKENGLVYHVRVPDAPSLPDVEKAVVAKPVAPSGPMSSSFTGQSINQSIGDVLNCPK